MRVIDTATGELQPRSQSGLGFGNGGGRPTAHRFPSRRPLCIRHQRVELDDDRFRLRSGRRHFAAADRRPRLPEECGANTAAEVVVHPSGKFVYGSTRGQDSIAVFAIDAATGKIDPVGHQSTQGKSPRNFAIDPGGEYLRRPIRTATTSWCFASTPQSGKLHATGESVSLPSPVCILMVHTP